MLGKLLKHEFRATGRTMLPIYGAVAALAVLGNLSIRLIDAANSVFLRLLFIVVIVFFVIGVIAAAVMTAVMMISRFYRNLLKEQGYLMHTLPVTVHGQIWSKLIVSLVWFAATFFVVWLVILLTGLIQSGTELGDILASFPSRAELRAALAAEGLRPRDLTLIAAELLVHAVIAGLLTCLHFYAAMSLGHMFPKSKVFLSVVFFVAISFLFDLIGSGYGYIVVSNQTFSPQTLAESLSFLHRLLTLHGLTLQFFKGALLYIATVFGLKKGLNLA